MLTIPDYPICGKTSGNSVGAPLATGSRLQAADAPVWELLPLTVAVSVGEVLGGRACALAAIAA